MKLGSNKRIFKKSKKISIFEMILLSFILLPFQLFSQDNVVKQIKVKIIDSVYQLGNVLIVPQSFILRNSNGIILRENQFKYIDSTRSIYFYEIPSDSISITYRTFPSIFSTPKFLFQPSIIESQSASIKNPFAINNELEVARGDNNELKKNGSISRGISVGNNQDLSVNSNFNLQLDGNLGEDIFIKASITDNNIPIQPEGNTQQIQDFDKIYIQLFKNKNVLTLGDYEIGKPDGYFLNFYKKLTGAKFNTSIDLKDSTKITSELAYAFARGKYNKLTFNGVDGNQGPYRLTGQNGEQIIIVLSGTERVFIDGQLLKRGEEYDYVIDYNAAELRFTPNKLITQFSRIIVEYEYSDKNYARNVLYQSSSIEKKNFGFRLNFYEEGDNKNQPILQSLDFEKKLILKNAGDNINSAFTGSADSVPFNANEVLYKRIDTLGYSNIYVYSQDKEFAHYRVAFSFVGANKGNYKQINSTANGRVFEFTAPVNGVAQGDYEAVRLLISPKRKRLTTALMNYNIDPNNKVYLELASSEYDINLFSNVDKANDQGYAVKFIFDNAIPLKIGKSGKTKYINSLNYEYKDKLFTPIERFREAEFERNFNIVNPNIAKYENLIGYSTGIQTGQRNNLVLSIQNFIQSGYSNGIMLGMKSDNEWKRFRLNYTGSNLVSEDPFQSSNFLKQEGEFSKTFNWLKAGTNFLNEDNRFKKLSDDSLALNSYSFLQNTYFIANPESWENKYNLNYTHRKDFRPVGNELGLFSLSKIYNANFELLKFENSNLRTGGFYREINYSNTTKVDEKNLLGRVEYYFTAWEDLISSNTYYEIGSGQEPRREYSYIEVPAGQGVYVFIDYNKNGIKELNEFEPAKFQYEANYIRISLPSNSFIKTNSGNLSQTFYIDPYRILMGEDLWKRVVRQVSYQLSYKKDQKIISAGKFIFINPVESTRIDSNLISLTDFIRHSILLGKNNPGIGLELNTLKNSNRFVLLNGFDTQTKTENSARLRFLISEVFSFSGETAVGSKTFQSEFLQSKNYRIQYSKWNPELSFQNSGKIMGKVLYSYQVQKNAVDLGGEKNFQQKLGTELQYKTLLDLSAIGKLNYIVNDYSGLSNTPVSYEMLDGLQGGKNFTWGLGIQRTLKNNLQLNFNYEGRKSEIGNAIHTGNVTARALF